AGLSFLAVYREAAETVLFTQALLLESNGQRAESWAGAAVGMVAVVGVAVFMSQTVMRLSIGPFFAVSSALLCGLAISFAGSGIYALVAAGYLSPRPVSFPEVPWMGIHPDLTGLLVQLAILTVLGKPDCHLCHVMADVARRAAAAFHAAVVERDVREDAGLFARYRHDIPVLLYEGNELFRHRVSEAE